MKSKLLITIIVSNSLVACADIAEKPIYKQRCLEQAQTDYNNCSIVVEQQIALIGATVELLNMCEDQLAARQQECKE